MSSERWEPVEEYGSVREEFVVDHNRIWVGAVEEDEWIVLPADLRLCRRVEPERPRPDWSQAPTWANWWACDPNGHSYWYKEIPILYETVDFAGWGQHVMQGEIQGNWRFCADIEIPLGIDWRTLIERRPEAKDE